MNKVHYIHNVLEPQEVEIVECDNVLEELTTRYTVFPKTARIYHEQVSEQTDVTPVDDNGVERLQKLQGNFYVVHYPEYEAIPYIIALVVAIVAAVALRNKPKIALEEKTDNGNNNVTKLSNRSNKNRYGERMADIYGTVKYYPDMLANSLIFDDINTKYEITKMCVGSGDYIVSNFKEGDELIAGKNGECVYAEHIRDGVVAERVIYNEDNLYRMMDIKGLLDMYSSYLKVNNKDLVPLHRNFNLQSGTYTYFQIVEGRLTLQIKTIEKNENIKVSQYYKTGDILHIETTTNDESSYYKILQNTEFKYDEVKRTVVGIVRIQSDQTLEKFMTWVNERVDNIFIPKYIAYENIKNRSSSYYYEFRFNGKPKVYKYFNGEVAIKMPVEGKTTLRGWQHYKNHEDNKQINFKSIDGIQVTLKPTTDLIDGNFVVSSVEEERLWLDLQPNAKVELTRGYLSEAEASTKTRITPVNTDSYKKSYVFESRDDVRRLLVSLNAPQGLYNMDKDSGRQNALAPEYGIKIFDITEGESLYHEDTKIFRGEQKTKRALSLQFELVRTLPNNRRFRVDVYCKTGFIEGDNVIQDVYVDSIQLLRDIDYKHMPECVVITTITRTGADAALTTQRSFNLIATRKLPILSVFGDMPRNAYPIAIYDIITNPLIGGMPAENVDLASLMKSYLDNEAYFGHNGYCWFNYAFKEDNLSMEEMLLTISAVCPVKIKRIGSKFFFEADLPMTAPKLLFNHRNIIPNSVKKTYNFGVEKDYDGVEIKFIDKDQDYIERTIQLPNSGLVKPRKVTLNGCTHEGHARMLGWREWNGLKFRSKTIQLDALQESSILTTGDFVIIPDELIINNHVISSGEILEVSGLKLTLSQPCNLQAEVEDTVIIIQHYDGVIEAIPCVVNDKTQNIWLNKAPRTPLNVDGMVKPLYWVTSSGYKEFSYYQVDEREAIDAYSSKITAQEYNPKIYEMDKQ
jgi:hypothetical protein|nr:MAG TPA: tail protein [Caudoviricetes sp.]